MAVPLRRAVVPVPFRVPTRARTTPNATNIEKGGGAWRMPSRRQEEETPVTEPTNL
jgi:hypothetical protein